MREKMTLRVRRNRDILMHNKKKPAFTSPNVHEVHEVGKVGFAEVRRKIARFIPL